MEARTQEASPQGLVVLVASVVDARTVNVSWTQPAQANGFLYFNVYFEGLFYANPGNKSCSEGRAWSVCVGASNLFCNKFSSSKKKSVPQMIENVCDNHFLFNLFLGSLVPLPVSFIIDACGMQRWFYMMHSWFSAYYSISLPLSVSSPNF